MWKLRVDVFTLCRWSSHESCRDIERRGIQRYLRTDTYYMIHEYCSSFLLQIGNILFLNVGANFY